MNFPQCRGVNIPQAKETLDLSTGATYMEARLRKESLRSLPFATVGNYKVTYLSASLQERQDANKSTQYEVIPFGLTEDDSHHPLLLRDQLVPLTKLREDLRQSANMKSEFKNGCLIFEKSSIVVRRHPHLGQVSIEGPPGVNFNRVRDSLYGDHAIV